MNAVDVLAKLNDLGVSWEWVAESGGDKVSLSGPKPLADVIAPMQFHAETIKSLLRRPSG